MENWAPDEPLPNDCPSSPKRLSMVGRTACRSIAACTVAAAPGADWSATKVTRPWLGSTCVLKVSRVTMANVPPPPPQVAQKRSAWLPGCRQEEHSSRAGRIQQMMAVYVGCFGCKNHHTAWLAHEFTVHVCISNVKSTHPSHSPAGTCVLACSVEVTCFSGMCTT